MKMIITEKQFSNILGKDEEIDEADSLASPSTTNQSYSSSPSATSTDDTGSSPSAADYPPYPEVGRWESGVTRGPANQIAPNSKWSEVVGGSLTRGKANPLK